MSAIPIETAEKLCMEISQVNRGKWYTFHGLWCWGCARFSGDISKRCFAGERDNRGCPQVTERYEKEVVPNLQDLDGL